MGEWVLGDVVWSGVTDRDRFELRPCSWVDEEGEEVSFGGMVVRQGVRGRAFRLFVPAEVLAGLAGGLGELVGRVGEDGRRFFDG